MTQSSRRWLTAGGAALLLTVGAGCNGCGGWFYARRPMAIPDRYPLGSVNRAHYHQMQTNGEASDFVVHTNDFVGESAELTPDGKDHVLEIAARMRSAPFPVVVERTEHSSNPQLDAERRNTIAQVLYELGNSDADQRTFVSMPYGRGITAIEGELDYYRFIYSRGAFGSNAFGNTGFGGYGAAGGGGFGGGGGGFF